MAFNDDSSASGHDEPWIQWFCALKGHEMFCEVERSYIEDGFNLYGLRACVSNFSDCLDLILDRIGPDDSDDSHLTQSACTLYGLIHARYIITAHGLDSMYNKYAGKEFGTCPLIQCGGQPVLPVGIKDEMGADTVKIYCPKCGQIYHPPPIRSRAGSTSGVDGAAFGTTFPHLFLMTFSNLTPDPLPREAVYVPRVFGFRVYKTPKQRAADAAAALPNRSSDVTAQDPAVVITEPVVATVHPDQNDTAAVTKSNEKVEGSYTAASAGTTEVDKANATGQTPNLKNDEESLGEAKNDEQQQQQQAKAESSSQKNNNNNNNDDNESINRENRKTDDNSSSRQSSGSRRKRKSGGGGGGGDNNNDDASKKDSNGGANPKFLLEPTAKRRRRNM